MDRQDRASAELFQAWHLGLVLLVVATVLALGLRYWGSPDPVPTELVKRRWLDAITLVRGQWLQHPRQTELAWQSPDGQPVQLVLDPEGGWPQPSPDCETLWRALMGQPSQGILAAIRSDPRHPDRCHYRLGSDREMTYFGRTGSLVIQTVGR
ncbi:hypothetical protein [Ferrimonas balearica]|uniref:hypothetical protein n=1 Tax=Ferrimonas balearica TaxID=44012 RepID=UPI001C99A7AC|nr:hypothetical protein [Ferrimonas balearica]MBY5993132.1 hypothetical protein [Ferrimonas balearica]